MLGVVNGDQSPRKQSICNIVSPFVPMFYVLCCVETDFLWNCSQLPLIQLVLNMQFISKTIAHRANILLLLQHVPIMIGLFYAFLSDVVLMKSLLLIVSPLVQRYSHHSSFKPNSYCF